MSYRREPAVNPTTWIVTVDRSHARIFEAHWPDLEDFHPLEEHEQAEGRMQAKEINAAAYGRGRGPDGRGSPYDGETDHRHDSASRIADEIVSRMETGRAQNAFGHVIVAAPPLVLGEMRRHFSPELCKLVEAEVDKELTNLGQREILQHVRRATESP